MPPKTLFELSRPPQKGPQPEVRLMWPGLLSASELKAEVHTLLAFG